ncbi:MAG: CBS domain-containing protein [bacterium]|nr:CBS domain-containing protein [bacterium]
MSTTRSKPILLRDVMTTDVATCTRDATLERAAQLMWEHDCGCVPIVDDARRPIGMLTDRDVCMGAYTSGGDLGTLPVARSMASDVQTCKADETIDDALRVMERRRIRRVPIVDSDGRLAGIVSMADIARQSRKGAADREHPGAVLRTLASISSPHASFEDANHQETIHV